MALTVTYDSLRKEIADYLGYGSTSGSWSADESDQLDRILDAGLRQFYVPPPVEGQDKPHAWYFLKKHSTISATNGDFDYDLPEDLDGIADKFTYDSAVAQYRLKQVDEAEIRALRAKASASGAPKYVAVRNTGGSGYEAIFYPTPDASYTIRYRYSFEPAQVTSGAPNPLGGVAHAETILASCLAIAEERKDGVRGIMHEKFMQRLSASIQADKIAEKSNDDDSSWAVTEAEYGTYVYFLERVGDYLGYGANSAAWDYEQDRRCNQIVQAALRRFYTPPPGPGERHSHEWTFMRPVSSLTTSAPYSTGTIEVASGVVTLTDGTWPSNAADGELTVESDTYTVNTRDSGTQLTLDDLTVTVAAGTSYKLAFPIVELPSDFGAMDQEFTYRPGTSVLYGPIERVGEHQIRARRQASDTFGRPQYAAIRPKTFSRTEGQRWEVVFWPTPDDDYTLYYRYKRDPGTLDSTNKYPPGGKDHAPTIEAACLAQAQLMRHGQRGNHEDVFKERLRASIDQDRQTSVPETLGMDSEQIDDFGIPYRSNDRVTYNGVLY